MPGKGPALTQVLDFLGNDSTPISHWQRRVYNSLLTGSTGITYAVLHLQQIHSAFREINCCVNLNDLRTSIK